MKIFDNNNHVKNLPDIYKKSTDSNNYKILELERSTCQTLRNDLSDISAITDIENAQGYTLDLYGDRIGQPRGSATDDQYLIMLKAKIMRNISNGSFSSVANGLCETFGCGMSDISIVEGNISGTILRVVIPISIINHAGLSSTQTYQIVKSLLPIGVLLDEFLIEGTFSFSATENEYDEEAGFGNSEQTIGGFFGATESY